VGWTVETEKGETWTHLDGSLVVDVERNNKKPALVLLLGSESGELLSLGEVAGGGDDGDGGRAGKEGLGVGETEATRSAFDGKKKVSTSTQKKKGKDEPVMR
jgi:hypothetical protein